MKLGRNEQCHCGSGKKYKKCCLRKDEEAARQPRSVDGPGGGISFSMASEPVAAAVQAPAPAPVVEQGEGLVVGKEYVIQPTNPRKTKNRDRHCELLALLEEGKAEVKFLDTNRKGKVDAEDLVLA